MKSLSRFGGIILCLLPCFGCQRLHLLNLGVEEITPSQLQSLLSSDDSPVVLDLRDNADYQTGHIPGALSIPPDQLIGYLQKLGPALDHTIITACYRGHRSMVAASEISALGYQQVYSLQGGMEAWNQLHLSLQTTANPLPKPGPFARSVVVASLFTQIITVVTAYGVKPLYMLLSLILILMLRRQTSLDLRLIRLSMVSFLLGEALCAGNFVATEGTNDILEIGHQLGMIGMNLLLPWGLFVFFDRRILRFTDPAIPCAAIRFCNQCYKQDQVACGFQRLFLFMTPALAILSWIPCTAPIQPSVTLVNIFGTDVLYESSLIVCIAEYRLYPLLACVLFFVTFAILIMDHRGVSRAQLPFFLGLGLVTFSWLRFFLNQSFRSMPPWSAAWEEITELIAVLAILLFLRVFRKPLGLSFQKTQPS